ncbi:hypothetical protein BT69DRAFT_1334347 [Atractiella rhizophila]|nr:hypothetical protein BT69DRAFT_1334347 [Atractiella rhizophila]
MKARDQKLVTARAAKAVKSQQRNALKILEGSVTDPWLLFSDSSDEKSEILTLADAPLPEPFGISSYSEHEETLNCFGTFDDASWASSEQSSDSEGESASEESANELAPETAEGQILIAEAKAQLPGIFAELISEGGRELNQKKGEKALGRSSGYNVVCIFIFPSPFSISLSTKAGADRFFREAKTCCPLKAFLIDNRPLPPPYSIPHTTPDVPVAHEDDGQHSTAPTLATSPPSPLDDPLNIRTFIISSAEENEDSPDDDETDSDERRPQKPPLGHCNTNPASLSDPSLPPPCKRQRRRYVQSEAFERRQARLGRYTRLKAWQTAATAHRFGMSYGAKNIRSWADRFETEQGALPMSNHGQHVKTFSLLNDLEHYEMLRAWVQQEKENMDPAKLAAYSQNVLNPSQLEKSMREELHNEMPIRLKGYLEETFFPNAGWKPKRGISLQTARKWLWREGFRWTEYKKGLYYEYIITFTYA